MLRVQNSVMSEAQGIAVSHQTLVEKIDMKIIKGPFASYVDMWRGIEGLTGYCNDRDKPYSLSYLG
jgi:hypothetical protein